MLEVPLLILLHNPESPQNHAKLDLVSWLGKLLLVIGKTGLICIVLHNVVFQAQMPQPAIHGDMRVIPDGNYAEHQHENSENTHSHDV